MAQRNQEFLRNKVIQNRARQSRDFIEPILHGVTFFLSVALSLASGALQWPPAFHGLQIAGVLALLLPVVLSDQ
jgi:hypothetical protein